MLRTAGPPSPDPWAFYVSVEMFGERGANFRIELKSPQDGPTLRLLDETGKIGEPVPLPHAEAAIRRVVEMRIPYRDIAAALPPEEAKLISGKQARPWVRVETQTWDARRQKIVDYGPSVASFRLVETPYALDPPLPERPSPPLKIPLPLQGKWLILQGAFSSLSHRNVWAYDLVPLDAMGHFSTPVEGKQNADYYAWGRPVFAPIDGRVLRARSDAEDVPPRGTLPATAAANEVYISLEPGKALDLLHFQKGSVTLKAGDRVTAGQQVGRVGNSGRSDVPHLHVALWTGRLLSTTAPLAFANVRVGLNPAKDDPWARELPSWEPRREYFVEAIEPPGKPTGN
jgi:murein DD-endopeptidase MepM/ murein hydrolase activator NlpD